MTNTANITMARRPVGKVRTPLLVVLLGMITLGIYSIVWHFSVFEELRNHRGQGWNGVLYLLFLIVPPLQLVLIATPFLIPAYVGRMYAEDGRQQPISGLSGFWIFLPLLGPIIWIFVVQDALNKYWQSKGAIA